MDISSLIREPVLACSYFVCVYLVCFGFSFVLLRIPSVASAVTVGKDRFGCIDGLRGMLAIGVMCHHSYTAMIYFQTGEWNWSKSPVLNHLGDSTVGIFFMITSFLFTRKVCRTDVSWKTLYRNRLARLAPLYFIVVLYVFLGAIALSGWSIREPLLLLIFKALQWICFVLFGRPDINEVPETWHLIAGVNWSLAYEWQFYLFAVPTLHLIYRFLGARGLFIVALAIICLCRFYAAFHYSPAGRTLFYSYFAAGCMVALLSDQPTVTNWLSSKVVRALCGSAILGLGFFQNDNGTPQIIFATLFFMAVVSNFSLLGLLRSRAAIWLGDISYGIYLIHGAALFWTNYTLKAANAQVSQGVTHFVLFTCLVGVIVLSAASLSYIFIELPVMTLAKRPSPTTLA